ncbi:MAG: sugar transferase [Planctomycetaceae bacterium]|jgi:lipopolysaccharide/colanic/teichoic acid biosynthesis glycosyltransferase|nr:sugar transferase [Planctomycetaceae bacterium]
MPLRFSTKFFIGLWLSSVVMDNLPSSIINSSGIFGESSSVIRFVENNQRCPEPGKTSYFGWKDYVDQILAIPLFVISIPIVLLAILIVRATSKGSGLYSQVRVGKDGKVFTMYKVRSMRVDAESATGAVWASKQDPRVTTVGRVFRKLHIDELPQLWNVIKGEMSLVGPRPERPQIVNILDQKIDGYIYRLYVKPGITGYAQLNQSSDHDLNDVRRKIVYDLEYIQHASFTFDLILIFGTILKSMHLLNERTLKMLGLYKRVEDSQWADPLLVSPELINPNTQTLSDILRSS